MPLINLISPANGFGNSADSRIVNRILTNQGYEVKLCGVRSHDRLPRFKSVAAHALRFRGRYDLNLFLGPIYKEWIPFARRNAIVPNAEWFKIEWSRYLHHFQLVFAKTHLTDEIFSRLGCRTKYISFTSEDKLCADHSKSYRSFLHVSSNPWKGTRRLLETWQAHPEWPLLTVVVNNSKITDIQADNIRLIATYVSNEEIIKMQNEHGVHICCSEAEGFGHYIAEAMSTRAVTLTTDAGPMNELVQPGRGLLVEVEKSNPLNVSTQFYFKKSALEQRIVQVLGMSDLEKSQIGEAARSWYLANDRFFREALPEAVQQALG